ncbi:Holliday junction branch migration protein RuvA [Paenibacillus endoradicis]|uniref:Holliday junction branch migration protein RuvA n=1 Tax=Paenibacillus endoradicis TaxID=2972487 RepID=UPI002159B143|nr:Holliday junction branch migration protein RuvA [Paenibacillus endoradicis]MCR8655734.1 Holliday junction branch migration protein RuvA [Paenibacillus endoradicis]MCR8658060.1 Holliday junction branch migration protein RuvA [Paenibacillus endoradicis]
MIDYLKGQVAFIEADYAVIEVNDIGYRVFSPNPYALQAMPQPVTVHIHYHAREDATLLFGFESRQQKALFRKFLDVSGIGPKVALGMLSAGKPEQLVAAIQQDNLTYLTKLPGIGKKTAQRIVLDLKDKLDGIGIDLHGGVLSSFTLQYEDAPNEPIAEGRAWKEAKDGLKALGYTETELDRAWQVLQHEVNADEQVDQLMKKALQQLFKG